MNHIIAAVLADPGIDPAFQAGVASTEVDQTAEPVRRALYVAALLRMDWTFDHSDDIKVWRRGRNELLRLRAERSEIDPDGALWAKHAPEGFRHG